MIIKAVDDKVVIEDMSDFDVEQIFNCGQAFRFTRAGEGVYEGVAFDRFLRIEQTGTTVALWPCTLQEFEDIWRGYFDLDTDYGEIKAQVSAIAPVLDSAVKHGYGIRILKQDPWEMIISFIISANNNIPRIRGAIEKLSERYGSRISAPEGGVKFSFPTPQALATARVDEIRACGVGYRDKYIVQTARMIQSGEIDLTHLAGLTGDALGAELTKFSGVGRKVAGCIMLFGFEETSAFPVDTWVRKVISKYFLTPEASQRDVERFVEDQFGRLAGYVQQYLFYYMREGLG